MAARLALTATVSYNSAESVWDMALEVTQGVNISRKVFLVEKKLFNGAWSMPVFVRVAGMSDLKKYKYSDPETDGGEYKSGYHYYLSYAASGSYTSWDAANNAYQHARAHIRSLVGFDPETTLTAELGLSVVGPIPERVSGTQYSLYSLDTCKFLGLGGSSPYAYSLEGDDTSSSIDSVTGVFVANNPGTCLVVVTDSMSSRSIITVTVAEPESPAALEVFDV